uniref:Uncharacterized protein n=1 Tax=Anguilla anguilla TaxID=7936 RepID=A0A0E9VVP3_ANGAN
MVPDCQTQRNTKQRELANTKQNF